MNKRNRTVSEEFYLDDLELRPDRFFNIEGTVTYEFENCECTSECGNQSVTERWVQCDIGDFQVDRLGYYVGTDGVETIRIPVDALSEKDNEIIKEALLQYEP